MEFEFANSEQESRQNTLFVHWLDKAWSAYGLDQGWRSVCLSVVVCGTRSPLPQGQGRAV